MDKNELKKTMLKLKMSPNRLADLLGISAQAVLLWMRGDRAVSPPAAKIIKVIGDDPSLIARFEDLN